jgi:hypothetical protein
MIQVFFFFRVRVSLSRGLCWFIPGVAVGTLLVAYLLTCWSVSPKQVWSQCLEAWEPSWFLSVRWHGEALCRLGVWGVRVLLILGGFFLPSVAPTFSAKFLIYRSHAVCFLPLVAILDQGASFLPVFFLHRNI